MKRYTARCVWKRDGYEEVELVDCTAAGPLAARRKIECKLLMDYQPGGEIKQLFETEPLFRVFTLG